MINRKLLPATIGALLAGGMAAAQADVTVFGHIDTSVVKHDGSNNIVNGNKSDTNFVCTTCSFGFKGSEDLGNGLKAIFKLDFQYDTTERNTGKAKASTNTVSDSVGETIAGVVTSVEDTSSITDRDQWLGLAGNFGQVRVGTISTMYKSHGAMLDPIYRTVAQARNFGIQSVLHTGAGQEGQGRATNTARYDSPNWNGLQLGATYTLNNGNTNDDDNGYGVGVSYENGGILVFVDYLTNNSGGDDSAYKLGAKYTLNNFSVFGQYEWDKGLISSFTPDTNGDEANVWMLGGTYTMGNNMITASYGKQEEGSGSSPITEGSNQWEIVGVHNLSKRSLLYGGYVKTTPDDSSDTTYWTAGMKHKF